LIPLHDFLSLSNLLTLLSFSLVPQVIDSNAVLSQTTPPTPSHNMTFYFKSILYELMFGVLGREGSVSQRRRVPGHFADPPSSGPPISGVSSPTSENEVQTLPGLKNSPCLP